MLTPECATRQWREIPEWETATAKRLMQLSQTVKRSHSWLRNTECTHTELVTQQLVFFFCSCFFFFNTGKTHWKWHSKSQNLLWDKVLAHIFKLEIQTTNKSTMFRFCTHQKWRFKETTQWKSDVEELQWRRNGCKGCFIHHHTLYPSFHNAPFISNCFYSSPPVSSHFFFSNHSW